MSCISEQADMIDVSSDLNNLATIRSYISRPTDNDLKSILRTEFRRVPDNPLGELSCNAKHQLFRFDLR